MRARRLKDRYWPVQGGIASADADDFTATVEAGVTREQLNEALRYTGLFFPVDPGADASLGGMAATRASGTNAVSYGTMRENVVRLRVVTANGRVIRTASRARKSSAGYDLTNLFIGSEVTLGIITELTVRIYPRPGATSAAVCNFATLNAAVASVTEIIQMGISVARVEFMDAAAVRATNAYSKLALRETSLLLFEFQGRDQAAVEQQASEVRPLRMQTAAWISNGPRFPRIVASCGKPGTKPTSRVCKCGLVVEPARLMCAYPSRSWRSV